MPTTFYATGHVIYHCKYSDEDVCDTVGLPTKFRTMYQMGGFLPDGEPRKWAEWSRADFSMWSDLDAGYGKEVYETLPGSDGWSLEKDIDLNAKVKHIAQKWGGSGEYYYCRTEHTPPEMAKWLDGGDSRSSYKGVTELMGMKVHHFLAKPKLAEHVTLDYYMQIDNLSPDATAEEAFNARARALSEVDHDPPTIDAIPFFVQLRIGPDLDDKEAMANETIASQVRTIAWAFTHFERLDALPADVSVWGRAGEQGHFNETVCESTLPYTTPTFEQICGGDTGRANLTALPGGVTLEPSPSPAADYDYTGEGENEDEGEAEGPEDWQCTSSRREPPISLENKIHSLDPFGTSNEPDRTILRFVLSRHPNATAKEAVEWIERLEQPVAWDYFGEFVDLEYHMRPHWEGRTRNEMYDDLLDIHFPAEQYPDIRGAQCEEIFKRTNLVDTAWTWCSDLDAASCTQHYIQSNTGAFKKCVKTGFNGCKADTADVFCRRHRRRQLSSAVPSVVELSGGNDGSRTTLSACVGECDADSQCAGSLKCFQRQNGETIPGCTGDGAGPTWDYCFDENWGGLKPLGGGNSGSATNLQACTGECDADSQCASGLKCYQRENGETIPGCYGAGGGPTWNYCHDPNWSGMIALSGGNDNSARNLKRCTGECDADSQCASGLKCYQRQNGEAIPGCYGAGAGPTWE